MAGTEIHQVYGLTESGGPACLISPDEAIAKAGTEPQPDPYSHDWSALSSERFHNEDPQ